jgi:hypothetical protein
MEMLFLHYFPSLRLSDFETPNGFPADRWDTGVQLIRLWMKQGK